MVMGQFVTTYRKDYLWPYVKTLGLRPEPEHIYSPQHRDQTYCKCHCLPAILPTTQQRTMVGPEALGDEEWSRLGPMGPLLEPKVFAAKVSTAPESEISRFNQPNVFMAKLQEKYPFIYECLRTAPPDDLIARINKDRLSSSYQVDYCHKQEYPNAPYDALIRAAGVEGLPPCPEPVRLPGDICRPIQKMMVYKRNGAFTSGNFKTGSTGGRGGGGGYVKDDAKQVQTPRIFEEKLKYTCPRSPPGPYYRPYGGKSCLIFHKECQMVCDELQDERTSCEGKNYVDEITRWDPFNRSSCMCSDVVEKWGKMIFRDPNHAHGGQYNLQPKKK